MQTFLPYPNMAMSVHVLDDKRLGKQRVECMQILRALLDPEGSPGWVNHPATKMWRGYERALGFYMTLAIREWIRRGYNNTMNAQYGLKDGTKEPQWIPWILPNDFFQQGPIVNPPWMGDERLHSSHRAVLLHKDPDWYAQWGWTEQPAEKCWWPVENGKAA
jgi:hypothetical protein